MRVLEEQTKDTEETLRRAQQVAARVLARPSGGLSFDDAREIAAESAEWEERQRIGRIHGHSSELEDVSEVEYRRLRLERVVLVALRTTQTSHEIENSLRELEALAETAGSHVLGSLVQTRATPDPGTFLGRGKAQELKELVQEVGADTVIVDSELSPSQRRSLEDVIRVKVIDRTALILDIFAQHAKSKEGKAQVELAQLEYLLPRLRGWGESMSRQAGGRVASGEGIGSRGPGETKIELDRRRIRARMAKLRRDIRQMAPARETRRASRRRGAVPSVVIAGYTNAGKSTLLNALSGAGVLVQDALFATLDPTVRKVETPDGRSYTLTDTVGFVNSLPTQLVEAFRSSLEEISDADIVLNVVDATHPDPVLQVQTVRSVLAEVDGYDSSKELIVLNKSDLVSAESLAALRATFPNSVSISARSGQGLEQLQLAIERALPIPDEDVELLLPFTHLHLLSAAHETGQVLSQSWEEDGVRLEARVDSELAWAMRQASD